MSSKDMFTSRFCQGLCPFTPKFHQQKPELEAGQGTRKKGARKPLYRRGKARETRVHRRKDLTDTKRPEL